MGCFLACFGSSKHNTKSRKEKDDPLQPPLVNKYEEDGDEEDKEEEGGGDDNEEEKEKEEESEKYEESVKLGGSSFKWSDLKETVDPKSSITLVESKGKLGERRRWCLSPVMCPVENITQWKEVKSQDGKTIQEQEEEEEEGGGGGGGGGGKEMEMMSTSLSTWLISGSESIAGMRCKCNGDEDKRGPMLSLEEIRQFSSSNCTPTITQRINPSPFMGIPNTTSKYSEDQKVKWHTTPFEMRLERALQTGFAQA